MEHIFGTNNQGHEEHYVVIGEFSHFKVSIFEPILLVFVELNLNISLK